MTNRMIPILVAALFASACMTAAQKKHKSDAEVAIAAAETAIASAKQGGGEAFSPTRMRSAEGNLRIAQEKLKVGDWEEAGSNARMGAAMANDLRNESEAARKRDAANKAASFKPGAVKKKTRSSTSK